jgi:hypothetical protein
MAILFACSEDGDGMIVRGLVSNITGSQYRLNIVRNALGLSYSLASTMRTPTLTPSGSTMGVRFYMHASNFGPVDDIYTHEFLRFDAGYKVPGFRVAINSTKGFEIRSNLGAVKASSAADYVVPTNTLVKVDCVANMALAGYVRVYVNDVLVVEWVGDTRVSGYTRYSAVEWTSSGANTLAISEIAVCDEDTRPIQAVALMYPEATGAVTGGWGGGAVNAVNKNAPNDSPYLYSTLTTATNISFALTNASTAGIASPAIMAMVATGRFAVGGGGNMRVKLGLYSSVGGLMVREHVLPSAKWEEIQEVFPVNPATGSAWTTLFLPNLEVAAGTVV